MSRFTMDIFQERDQVIAKSVIVERAPQTTGAPVFGKSNAAMWTGWALFPCSGFCREVGIGFGMTLGFWFLYFLPIREEPLGAILTHVQFFNLVLIEDFGDVQGGGFWATLAAQKVLLH
jgi:hypothetical protein